jgi:hypothetical protein
MSRFKHPHLTRGVVYTPAGAFTVCRGVIEAPEAIGEECGWRKIDDEQPSSSALATGQMVTLKQEAVLPAALAPGTHN